MNIYIYIQREREREVAPSNVFVCHKQALAFKMYTDTSSPRTLRCPKKVASIRLLQCFLFRENFKRSNLAATIRNAHPHAQCAYQALHTCVLSTVRCELPFWHNVSLHHFQSFRHWDWGFIHLVEELDFVLCPAIMLAKSPTGIKLPILRKCNLNCFAPSEKVCHTVQMVLKWSQPLQKHH